MVIVFTVRGRVTCETWANYRESFTRYKFRYILVWYNVTAISGGGFGTFNSFFRTWIACLIERSEPANQANVKCSPLRCHRNHYLVFVNHNQKLFPSLSIEIPNRFNWIAFLQTKTDIMSNAFSQENVQLPEASTINTRCFYTINCRQVKLWYSHVTIRSG